MRGRISWASLCALILAVIFLVATQRSIDFTLGTVGDEWAKIDAVRTGNNRYCDRNPARLRHAWARAAWLGCAVLGTARMPHAA
jgi:hypothetical protein